MTKNLVTIIKGLIFCLCIFSTNVQAQTPIEVVIEGLADELLANVKLVLSIEQQKGSGLLVDSRIHRLHQKAEAEIRTALEPFGYYRATVTSSLRLEDEVWHAHYHVESGPQIPIASSDIIISGEAGNDETFTTLLQSHQLQVRKPFVHSEYEQFKRQLHNLADERGYLDAHFTTNEVKIDASAYRASVVIHFNSGARYRFGAAHFTGEHPFSEDFLRRYLGFKTGDYYEHKLLTNLQKTLFASEYFKAVDVQVERTASIGQHVPVTVQLEQRPRKRYQFGIGYGTDTGVRGLIGHERRWLNPYGHRFSSELKLSEIRNSIAAQHTVPLARPESDRLVNRAEYYLDTGGDVDSRRSLISSSVERALGRWRNQWGVSYQLEDYTIGLQSGDSTLLILRTGWNTLQGYDLLGLLRGFHVGLELRGASKNIISDTDFLQARLNAKSIVPAGKGRLLLRGEAGATAVEAISLLPPSQRFFAGGDNSIRGYAYRHVGPTDASGDVVGGRHLLVGSIEYDYPLNALWRAALFLDGGNVFDDHFEKAMQGAGIGLRRKLPIGLLRIDVAEAISDPERPWRLHLTMGLEL